jgi:hypothetical protein
MRDAEGFKATTYVGHALEAVAYIRFEVRAYEKVAKFGQK